MFHPKKLYFPLTAVLALAATTIANANGDIIGMVESVKGSTATRVPFAVVSLTEVPGSFSPSSRGANMNQKNKEFAPHVLAIMKGTKVHFNNSDPFFHNIFSSSRTKTFNVSQTKKGDSSEVTFDKIGVVPIRCHIHANMKAYIVILPNPFFDVTNDKGLFKISNVPPGNYTIKVWHPDFTAATQTVQVPASGEAKVVFKVS
jgi:plastocyanin